MKHQSRPYYQQAEKEFSALVHEYLSKDKELKKVTRGL